MPAEFTPRYNLAKPDVNGAETENVWGFDINLNFDKLDAAIIKPAELSEAIEDQTASLLRPGANIALSYNDNAGTLTITGLIGTEEIDDRVAALLKAGPYIGLAYNDAAGTITINNLYGPNESQQQIFDTVKAGNNVAIAFDELGGRITIHSLGPGGSTGPQNVFDTIHDVRLAEIPAQLKVVTLSGYNRPGDAGPAMPCRRTQGPVTAHAGWFRTADRFKADGFEDPVNGGYWEYIGNNQPVWIEWFGGAADYMVPDPANPKGDWLVNSTPTDNAQPLDDAIDFVYSYIKHANPTQPNYPLWSSGGKIQLGLGHYYKSRITVPTRTVTIQGMGGYGDSPITWIRVPDNTTAFRFEHNYPEKAPAAAMSILRDFAIRSVTDNGSTDVTKHAIIMHTALEISHMNIECFAGNGIDIATNAEFSHTMANCFYLNHIFINYCGGHGVYTSNADSNAGLGIGLNIVGCGRLIPEGYAIYDGAFLANSWYGCHANGCGRTDVDGYHGGAYYAAGVNAPTVFIGCYSESNQGRSYCGPQANFIGGQLASGITVADRGSCITGNRVINGFDLIAGAEMLEDYIGVRLHTKSNVVFNFSRRDSGGIEVQPYDFTWLPTLGVWGMRYANLGQLSYAITGDTYTYSGGRPQPLPPNQFVIPDGLWLGGRVPGDETRKIDIGFEVPVQGAYAIGERRFHSNPVPGGSEGWVCTQTGFLGVTWTAGLQYFPPTYAKNAGHWYRMDNQYGAVSANAPVHTSGTVTGADGMAWEHLGTGDAVWKTFGMVGALERAEEHAAMIAELRGRIEALEAR